MILENYTIISASSLSFEEARHKMKEKVLDACNHGLRLQGNVSVQVVEYAASIVCYNISQTMIGGEQKIIDYDIICTAGNKDSQDKATHRMRRLLARKYNEGWEIQGGASVDVRFKDDKSCKPSYTIYQTVVKEDQ